MTPADPRVRAFLDAMADAVAIAVVRELRSGELATPTQTQVRRTPDQGKRGAQGASGGKVPNTD
jgi:hypothetical protein